MNLESQVCSLELAKRLKELGVKQESVYFWKHSRQHYCGNKIVEAGPAFLEPTAYYEFPEEVIASAFTVAELGELLPSGFFSYRLQHDNKTWQIGDYRYENHEPIDRIYKELNIWALGGDTEADARARMLVYLIEQGIVKPKES